MRTLTLKKVLTFPKLTALIICGATLEIIHKKTIQETKQ